MTYNNLIQNQIKRPVCEFHEHAQLLIFAKRKDSSMCALEGNEVDCVEALSSFRGDDSFFDPYCLYLGTLPAKIMYSIAFDHSYDFSKAFDKLKRALTIISSFMFKCYYIHPSCMLRCLISSCALRPCSI